MTRIHRLGRARRLHVAVAVFAATVLVAACEPGFVTTFAGTGNTSGTVPSATVSPVSSSTSFRQPTSLVATPDGGSYVYDATACAVYHINSNGTTSLYAGAPGVCGTTGDGGPATNAQINANYSSPLQLPGVMATNSAGDLYFTSDNGLELRKVDHATGAISTISAPQPSAATYQVTGLATDTDGSVVVQSEALWQRRFQGVVYRLSSAGAFTALYTYPTGQAGLGLANIGPGKFATLIMGGSNFDVGRVDVTAGTLTDTGVAYNDTTYASVLAGAPDGTIYVGNPGNAANTIVRIDPDNMVTRIAGSGMADPGTGKQGGTGTQSMITPAGMTVTSTGLLFSSGRAVYRLNEPAQVGVATTMPGMPTTTMPGMPTTTMPGMPTTTMPGMPTTTMPGMPDNISIPTNSPAGPIIWPMPMADMMMDPGMEMVTPTCTASPTAAQQAAALALVNTTVADVAPYKSLSYATAHGYIAVTPSGLPVVHYVNMFNLSTTLNPAKIGSLVYANTTHGAVLVAAMYMLPLNDIGMNGPQPGGCLNEWHIHTNLCYSSTGFVVNITNSAGKCPAGETNRVTSPMMHVWLAPVAGGPLVMDASDQKAVAAAETLPLLSPLNGRA